MFAAFSAAAAEKITDTKLPNGLVVHEYKLKNGMQLSDNPGILWPKIEDEDDTNRLAFGGAFPDSARTASRS